MLYERRLWLPPDQYCASNIKLQWVYSYYSRGLYCLPRRAAVGIAAQDANKSLSFSRALTLEYDFTYTHVDVILLVSFG
jgi:hypothetical protein